MGPVVSTEGAGYPKVRDFMQAYLFSPSPVNLEDPVVLRNLSEPDAGKILYDAFKSAINALTIQESGTTRIEARIRLKERGFVISKLTARAVPIMQNCFGSDRNCLTAPDNLRGYEK